MIAHIRDDGTEQSVEEHCLNTAGLAARFGKPLNMENMAETAGLLHDIGKLTTDFSLYIRGDPHFSRGSIDHSYAGGKYLCDSGRDDKSLGKASQLLARVIFSHHGLHDWVDHKGNDYFRERLSKNERYDEIIKNARDLSFFDKIPGLLKKSAEEYKTLCEKIKALVNDMHLSDTETQNKVLAFCHGMSERLLTSVLTDADRTDTACFMSGETLPDAEYDTDPLWVKMEENLGTLLADLGRRTDPVSVQRRKISERCAKFSEHPVGICRLVVPTGGGKTLSSLRFAIRQCRIFHKKKIIYVAPFMSIIEQNSEVIRSLSGNDVFLEHHSDAFARADTSSGNDLSQYELHAERWDSPVIATTMVQFLNTLFSESSSCVRRMHRLSDAVIIFDEVQSLPLRCTYLFNLAMNFLSKICGSTIVLCSATQPPLETMEEYPLTLDACPDMAGDTSEDFAAFRRTKIINLLRKSDYSYDEAAEFCLREQRKRGSLLLIVNTKNSALELYRRLSERSDAKVIHLSTNMCAKHRKDKIASVREYLETGTPVICVTTQLIEAGVDISFPCVVRALAGLDSIAQAAGRCNRNGESDRLCPVYLMHLREEKLYNLTEIATGQSITRGILSGSERTDDDVSEYLDISAYFAEFYRENKKELCFPCKDGSKEQSDTLLDLLSVNGERCKVGGLKCGFHRQAFQTAGSEFEVITGRTESILVPYEMEPNAKKAYDLLKTECRPNLVSKLLRVLQPYLVEVYKNKSDKLEKENALTVLPSGVPVLDDRFYSDECGLTTEAEQLPQYIL